MNHDDRLDDELARLLACVRAEADPALWTRVRVRMEAGERGRAAGWLAWWMRPAALRASFAVFVVAAATSAALVATAPRTLPVGDADNLTDALVSDASGEAGAQAATPATGVPAGSGVTTDSGGTR